MKMTEFYQALKTLDVPVAYNHFDAQPKSIPFIAYTDQGKDTFLADDTIYAKSTNIRIELYTTKKDLEMEEKLENLLDSIGLIWSDEPTIYIKSEKLFLHAYSVTI